MRRRAKEDSDLFRQCLLTKKRYLSLLSAFLAFGLWTACAATPQAATLCPRSAQCLCLRTCDCLCLLVCRIIRALPPALHNNCTRPPLALCLSCLDVDDVQGNREGKRREEEEAGAREREGQGNGRVMMPDTQAHEH